MLPERWQQVERLYHAALERVPAQRGAFLAEACNSDNELRREVESLLQQETSSSGSPMDRPVLEGATGLRDSPTVRQLAPGAQLGPYKIEAPLGAGGMGEVFRAVDTRLQRTVALKVLSRERMADPEHRRRFLQEARAASALNHPNIVVLHDISRDSGTDFLVMEYVQGQTLENLIGADGLPFDRVTEYGAQIASALAAAHSAGIVHRDIKPANIMITQDNQIKVLDFGVAKFALVGNGSDVETSTAIQGTIPGMVVGTVAYMSPEQTRGEPVDARSDIFSLGCVLYQTATGKRPFGGSSTLAIMHEIATVQPPPPSTLRSELPGAFDTLIAACLEKNPIHRPATAGDVALKLKSLLPWEESIRHRTRAERRSVAVLPFKLRTSIQEDQFLAVALADALVTRLAATGKLLVRPTASVLRYAGKDTEWTQAAREMNVDLVVEGSIQKMGTRVRVLVQAHQVTGALTPYSAKHDGEMEDLFGLQDRIADAVSEALVPKRQKAAPPAVPPTKNSVAYELYMRAADRISRLNKWDTQTAVEMLTSATGFDPNFADAWGRLAQACIQMGVVFDSDPGWLAKAEAAVARALALDMAHADAFCARGQLLWTPTHAFQNRPALRALNSALKLNPGCHQAQIWRGLIFFHVGLYAEARQGLEEALAVQPEDTRTIVFLAQTALYRGDYEEAYELDRRALALDPAGVWQNLFFPTIPLYLGRPSEAAEALRKASQMVPGEATLASVEGLIAAHAGDFRRAEQLIDAAVESNKTLLHTHHLWHNAASAYAMCGKPDKAMKWLRECADMGLPNYLLFGSDPHLRGLHNRPEFLALMSGLRREHDTYREEFGLAGGNYFV
jgi:serine/threonine protein kinase/tetratricopeptide (TPR) repeat protein